MKNKILLFVGLIATILFGFSTKVAAQNITTSDDYEKYLERNWKQVQLSTKIQNRMKKYYNIKDSFRDLYPDYYGGIYISDDAKNLIIQIVKENIPSKESDDYLIYEEIIGMNDNIIIEYVDNSLNELNAVNNYIIDSLMENKLIDGNLISTGLDIMNNSVSIELKNNSTKNQRKIKDIIDNANIVDKDVIKFKSAQNHTPSANINAGGKIWLNSAQTSYCSMGMRVNYNGNKGYLTAGHCAMGYTSFPSGTIQVKQFYNNQYYDYAFVKTNSSYTPTNNLQSYSVSPIPSNMAQLGLINYCPTITVNMAISKNGARTGYTTGNVTALNQAINYDIDGDGIGDTLIYGLITSNVYQGQGDSGGVVMIPRTDANGGPIGLGILSGGVNMSYTMHFSDLNVLPIALQNRY